MVVAVIYMNPRPWTITSRRPDEDPTPCVIAVALARTSSEAFGLVADEPIVRTHRAKGFVLAASMSSAPIVSTIWIDESASWEGDRYRRTWLAAGPNGELVSCSTVVEEYLADEDNPDSTRWRVLLDQTPFDYDGDADDLPTDADAFDIAENRSPRSVEGMLNMLSQPESKEAQA